jgi:hexosaminidase
VFDSAKKQLAVSLVCELAGVDIHYTSDGSEPNNLSPLYSAPVILDKSVTMKAITFAGGIPAGKPMSQSFNFNKATGKPVKYMVPYSDTYKGSGEFTLVNGLRGSSNGSDGEWQGWSGMNMEVIIDLQQAEEINHISVGALQNTGSWIFFPKKLEFFISEDGLKFQKVAEIENKVDPLLEGNQLKDFSASFSPVIAKFVKVVAYSLGQCPKGHAGEGKAAWLFIDEIGIE